MLRAILILLPLIGVVQQPPDQNVEYGEPTGFEIEAKKSLYYTGEPVGLKLIIYNQQNKPIKGSFLLTLGYDVTVYYRKVGGGFIEYSPWRLENQGHLLAAPVVIPANGMREGAVGLFYNSPTNKLVLAEPGEYEFKAQYTQYESNIVRVTVMHPPEEERAALAALSDPELLQFVEGDISMSTSSSQAGAVAEKAALFLKTYPQSIYSPVVEKMLRSNLEEATRRGKLTPKLQAIKERLPEK